MSSSVEIPVVGEVPVKYIINIAVLVFAVFATILYAFFFTSKQQSDIPTTYGTVRRNKDINDTMTELLGKNWVAVVIAFYIMTILLMVCLYALNMCAKIEFNAVDAESTKYTIWGIYGLIAVAAISLLVRAGWYYVNDYNFVIDTPVIEYEYARDKRKKEVATVALFIGAFIFMIVSSVFAYNYYKKN